MRSHSEQEQRIASARSTLIDALRLCDQGMLAEAMVGCAMAMAFLAPVTSLKKAEEIVAELQANAEKREQLLRRRPAPG